MKGFRGLLTLLTTWILLLGDTFMTQVSGVSPGQLKAALIASLPITVKLIWTDARPKILAMVSA